MRLKRGGIVGYDSQSMSYRFTMLSEQLTVIACEISSVALADLGGPRNSTHSKDAQFLENREVIERMADQIYEQNQKEIIHLFAKHFK